MSISIDQPSLAWFKSEFTLASGQGIHLFGKVYGKTTVHDGFSVGIESALIENSLDRLDSEGITFFTTKQDEWFFSGYDVSIKFNQSLEEPEYYFAATNEEKQA